VAVGDGLLNQIVALVRRLVAKSGGRLAADLGEQRDEQVAGLVDGYESEQSDESLGETLGERVSTGRIRRWTKRPTSYPLVFAS
jgi:uncharacterized protein YidB (DUF937 family)